MSKELKLNHFLTLLEAFKPHSFFNKTKEDLIGKKFKQMLLAVQLGIAIKRFALAHELGHLFGCRHDDVTEARTGFTNNGYRYGFIVDHPGSHYLNTIMS